jgi:hypothetical protein
MADKLKKSMSRRYIMSVFFSFQIMALFFSVLPMSNPAPVLGVYSNAESATGLGTPIEPKGKWFMYNEYTGGTATYDIVAGNSKNGPNIIGSYTVTQNGDSYTANYTFNPGVTVVESHLSVSSNPNFTGNPGQDTNASFSSFSAPNNSGSFYIFAHFSVVD